MGACLACAACQACVSVFSICCSCVGCCKSGEQSNDPLVGRVRSLSLMLFSVVLAVAGQYWIYKLFEDRLDAWDEGCDNPEYTEAFRDLCIGNTFVYRVSFVDSVFFLAMALCACCSPAFNNGFWGFKLFLWSLLLLVCIFLSNDVFDTTGYVWPARVGAFIFTIMQQVVLIDLAYRVNDGLVAKANEHGGESEGKPYLVALVSVSAILYAASLSAIGVMFHYFSDCPANDLVLSLTLILPIVVTALQLTGGEGNLLASAVVTTYATFLCFSAVSKTPTSDCNPFVGETNATVVIIGIALTVLSLFWVTLNAQRTVTALLGGGAGQVEEAEGPVQASAISLESGEDKSKPFVQSAVPVGDGLEGGGGGAAPAAPVARPAGPSESAPIDDGGLGWRFNVVMVLISMFYAMMLTNWGDINRDGESSNPKNGWTAMWLTTAGQWVCFLLYGWTLVAPRVFPDRDFS